MFTRLYKYFLLIPGLSVAVVMSATADDSITVIKSTESELHIKIDIDPLKLQQVTDEDSVVHAYKSLQFAIPFDASVRIAQFDFAEPVAYTGRQVSISPQQYEVAGPIEVRGMQIMMLRLFPITASGCYSQAEVHVLFEGGQNGTRRSGNDGLFGRVLKRAVVNYDQSSGFIKQQTAQKISQVSGPFDGLSNWAKIDVNLTGLYRVTGADLESAGIDISSLNLDDIHLYSGGGLQVHIDNAIARPRFEEVAIQIVDDGDDIFEATDYFLFFGESVDRWIYPAGGMPVFSNHPYSPVNVYWVSTSASAPVRWSTRSVAVDGAEDTVIQDYSRRIRVETDNLLRKLKLGRVFDYYTWYWTNEPDLDFFISTPGRIVGDTAEFFLAALTSDPTGPGDNEGFVNLTINGASAANKLCNQKFCTYTTANLVDGLNQLHLDLWGSGSSEPYFDYLELTYSSSLLPMAGQLDLFIDPSTDRARMDVIDNIGTQFTLLDISNPLSPVELTDYSRSSGIISFSDQLSAVEPNRFLLVDLAQTLRPLSIKRAEPDNLYRADQQADLIIVAADNLVSGMDEYIEYRESEGYVIKIVSVTDIMDNFSFGLYDPGAIRDYLKYAYENYPAPAPSGVLFVGDGTYDYLDILGTGMQNFVPPFQLQADDPTSDDNYVFFGAYGILDSDTSYVVSGRGFDMHTGRWPVRSRSEINAIVAKIKQYESPSTYGPWRNRITLVADDEHGAAHNETIHTIQTIQLDKDHIPASFSRNRIYLWDYPFVNQYKPAVNDVIVKSINDGTLIINYVGHGNPDVWAHERVFTRDGDLPRLNNFDKLPLVYAASCAIGFFDDPQREGMAEEMLAQPTGGCIGAISATRLVYSSENAAFNRQVFDVLLTADSLSISEALFLAKLQRQYRFSSIPVPNVNDRTYAYFGDPLLKLGMPRLEVEFGAVPDSLTALSTIHIDGRVRTSGGSLFTADGVLHINVFDTEREKTYRLVNDNGVVTQKVDYSVNGPAVFRGTASITAGEFSFDFVTPLDIGYGGKGGRITTYAAFENIDGIGLIDSLDISSQIAPSTDSTGPTVVVSFPGQTAFVSGDPIRPGSNLQVALSDSSGINLTGGLGHGITLIIDDRSEDVINLSPSFAYNQDDFTSGELTYALENVSPGQHSFKIKAWDNANNSSAITFTAEVLASTEPAIVDLLNYPNPMQESTRFSYRLTQPVSRFTLEIYTLSGRKIKSFDSNPIATGYFDDIIWYGDDFAGDRVATGVYIYKAVAIPETGGEAIESFGKVVVVN